MRSSGVMSRMRSRRSLDFCIISSRFAGSMGSPSLRYSPPRKSSIALLKGESASPNSSSSVPSRGGFGGRSSVSRSMIASSRALRASTSLRRLGMSTLAFSAISSSRSYFSSLWALRSSGSFDAYRSRCSSALRFARPGAPPRAPVTASRRNAQRLRIMDQRKSLPALLDKCPRPPRQSWAPRVSTRSPSAEGEIVGRLRGASSAKGSSRRRASARAVEV
mmetsp:Transcript_163/g.600  ORF Transcript_163/g.600 Transcript_163/m.600 type:complete len:220 (-) Transcript_163:98-757(-)